MQIARAAQSIAFDAPPDRLLHEGAFALTASAAPGLPVGFASLSGATCSVDDDLVTPIARGTCRILASQPGSANYEPATSVERTFQVLEGVDLGVEVDNGRDELLPSDLVVYDIVVTNAGPGTEAAAAFTVTPSPALVDVIWTCEAELNATCVAANGSGPIAQSIGLAPGSRLRYRVQATVDDANASSAQLAVGIATTTVDVIDIDGSDNADIDQDPVLPFGVFFNGFEGK